MDNKCPKCGIKLSTFYIKQNCPECGCDLLFYGMEAQLEEDAAKAQEEFAALDRFLAKLTKFLPKKKKNDEIQ